jgi:CDP-glucose 4,6-dehydratase
VAKRHRSLEGMVMNLPFWKNKRVLITGHTGFKGSWLSLWLQKNGARVIGYALQPPTEPSLFVSAKVAGGMISTIGDVRNLQSLSQLIIEQEPEIVFHMAAQALVRRSYEDPTDTFSTNIMGTANILEAIRTSDSVKSAVIITSDKCYENNEWIYGYRENDPMGGHDPYSSSKGCAELVTSAYIRSFFSPNNKRKTKSSVATARAGNVIGGGDWSKDRLVPDIMASISKNNSVTIRYPRAIRPWQHVLEPLRAYLMLAEKLYQGGNEYAGAWNFGPDDQDAKPVSYIVDAITQKLGEGARWVVDSNEHPHEATYLKLDCTKAKQLLGWYPVIKLPMALNWIVEWYQCFKNSEDMHQHTLGQINRYEKLVTETSV